MYWNILFQYISSESFLDVGKMDLIDRVTIRHVGNIQHDGKGLVNQFQQSIDRQIDYQPDCPAARTWPSCRVPFRASFFRRKSH